MNQRFYLSSTPDREEMARRLKGLVGRPITIELATLLDVDPNSVVKSVGSDDLGDFFEYEPMETFTTALDRLPQPLRGALKTGDWEKT